MDSNDLTPHRARLREVKEQRDELRRKTADLDSEQVAAVDQARAAGMTWTEAAALLGMKHPSLIESQRNARRRGSEQAT